MTAPDQPDNGCLHFASSETQPLACMAGTAISLGQFRTDVERLATQLQRDGDTLISCPGRYAFSVGLLASWLNDRCARPGRIESCVMKLITRSASSGYSTTNSTGRSRPAVR